MILFSEIKQFFGADIQYIANIKHHIKGNGAVSGLDPAHVGAADVHQLSQCTLGQSPLLPVVGDVQPQIPIFVVLLFFHGLTPE